MANGIIGQEDLPAATNTTVAITAAAGTININVCNRNATQASVRLALAAAASPVAREFIEYGAAIPGNTPLERTGLAVGSGVLVVAYSDVANVSVTVMFKGD